MVGSAELSETLLLRLRYGSEDDGAGAPTRRHPAARGLAVATYGRLRDNAFHLCAAKNVAQFVLCVFENSLLSLRQIFPGAIDVEIQHRHRGLIRCALAPVALFGGMFQRTRDFAGIF